MSAIPVTVPFNSEEMRRAATLHFDQNFKKKWRATKAFSVLTLLFGIFTIRYEVLPLSAFLIAAGILGLFIRKLYIKRCITAGEKSPYFGEEQIWTFYDQHLHIQRPGQESKLGFEKIVNCLHDEHGLLLYTTPSSFFWLPVSGFPSEEAFTEAIERCETKLVPS